MLVAGRGLLIIALAVCAFGAVASLYGARSGRREFVDSGRRAVYALAGVLLGAFAILETAFLSSDFSFELVGSHSSTTTPAFYKATAIWSSQEGSLLLWVTLLALWSSAILYLTRNKLREVTPYAAAVLLGFGAFFCTLLVFVESPFVQASPAPAEGAGLNPLLRHPSMMIHPPMLYSGYTLFAVPFAFAIGALITRRSGPEWIRVTRPFSLAAWFFLGVGVILGARWSYTELGWGGYWAWDPVENASLMPWLTGTAFLHSVMIQEKRGMLKVWNASLVLATGTLAILGTFLVRSGILDSIHAFGASTLGTWFLLLILAMIGGSIYLLLSRADSLRSEHRLESLLSREGMFLLNNLVLVVLCFVVFWFTFFPLISEAITGNESSVGPPTYSLVLVPIALILVLLSGLGPVIPWRRATAANLRRLLAVPVGLAVAVLVALLPFGVADKPRALLMFALGAFVLAVVGQELVRGWKARRVMSGDGPVRALVQLIARNRRRYGGYVVHAGISILFIGIAASSAFQHARDVELLPGQTARVGGYEIVYRQATADLSSEKLTFGARIDVRKDGRTVTKLAPTRGYYPSLNAGQLGTIGRFFEGEATSEVGLRAGLRRDVWVAVQPDLLSFQPLIDEADAKFKNASPVAQVAILGALSQRYINRTPPATFRIIVSPLVTWIWIGALVVFLGGLIALLPGPPTGVQRMVSAGYAARLARELGARAEARV